MSGAAGICASWCDAFPWTVSCWSLTRRFFIPGICRHRRHHRNEPMTLPHILWHLAAAMGLDPAIVGATTTATARRFFGLPSARGS